MKYVSYDVGALRWSMGTTVLRQGDSFDDDHLLVTERPELFTDEAPGARFAADAVPNHPSRVESTMRSGPAGPRVENPIPVVKAPPRGNK